MLAPDDVAERVFDCLCVSSFEGLPAAELWDTLETMLGEPIAPFTRQVVWSWVRNDPRLLVGRYDTAGASASKRTFVPVEPWFDSDKLCGSNLVLKTTADAQSIYLTGVKASDNALGKMPYDLLRIIAKHRHQGINSIDLVREAGQDSRSLTNRLQVLESNQLIVKMGVSAGKHSTNHMYHFRFVKSNTVVVNDSTDSAHASDDRYDRYLIITEVMRALKCAPPEMPVRLTRDLFAELRVAQPGLRLRWFNSILRFLVVHNYAELIQVEHGEKKRFFPAARFLKDLPESSSKMELLGKIKAQEKLDSDQGVALDDAQDDPIPQFTRFSPLVNQIRNFISDHKGCMISEVEAHLSSVFRPRQVSHFIENMVTTSPKTALPGYIIGEMIHFGKVKMYKLVTFEQWSKEALPKNVFRVRGVNDKTLLEINADYMRSFAFDRRIQILELVDPDTNSVHTFMAWKPKKNSPLQSVTGTTSLCTGPLAASNGLVELQVSRTQTKLSTLDTAAYVLQMQRIVKYVQNSNLANETVDVEPFLETITVKETVPAESTAAPMDLGPTRRRNILLDEVNTHKCVCISVDFCNALSSRLGVDYTIDRRTLIRDAKDLESKGQVATERLDGKKFIVKSVVNVPSTDDIIAFKEVPKKTFQMRTFTDKVFVKDIVMFDERNLKRGLKFPDKETRLKNATERNKEFISETGRVVRRRRKRKVRAFDEEEEDSQDENDQGKTAEDDYIGHIMDKRKRKKFKPTNKQQARVARAFKKMRTSIKMDEDHILLYIKAIVITQCLNTSKTIDWPRVASVFEEAYNSETLRRMWPRYKKLLGAKNVIQARKNWESVLLSAVENRLIGPKHLKNYSMERMLDLWKAHGTEIFLSKSQMAIAKNYKDNFKDCHFEALKEDIGLDVYKEAASLIEKEQAWAMRSFTYPLNEASRVNEPYKKVAADPTPVQLARVKLKALFATPVTKFSGLQVKKLFENIPKEVYSKALTELEDERAIAFLGESSSVKFTLTDKVMMVLECKLTPEFVESATDFESLVSAEVDTSHTGILLSAKSPVGVYAPLFNYIAQNAITVTRIDQKPMSLDSYSTKSRDRSKLESDFLLSHFKGSQMQEVPAKPVVGPPCSAIWIDLMGDFNVDLWKRCVCVIVWEILFHPGTKIGPLCRRTQPLLEPHEVKLVVDWMIQRRCVVQQGDCYWATYTWYHLF